MWIGSRGDQRRAGRSAACAGSAAFPHPGSDPFGGERQQFVRRQAPRMRPGRGERALERAPETAERGFRPRSREARHTHRDEHAIIRARERRTPRMQCPPTGVTEQSLAPLRDDRVKPSGAAAARPPGRQRGAEPGARPVNDLDRRAIRRGIGQDARERAQRLRIDSGERRHFQDESVALGIDVEFRLLVPGPPGQEVVQRLRARWRHPRRHRVRAIEEVHEARDHGAVVQPAGSITTRTQLASW